MTGHLLADVTVYESHKPLPRNLKSNPAINLTSEPWIDFLEDCLYRLLSHTFALIVNIGKFRSTEPRGTMDNTFSKVADIISEVCNIERARIRAESHTIDDLGIDSLDFLDVTFAIDKSFGIKMPIERWMQDVNEGRSSAESYFVLRNLCARIDELVAAKAA
ncbi:MAG: acyl carrier protein [Dongiaceae bacterium]